MIPRETYFSYQIAIFLHGVFVTLLIIIVLNFKFPCFVEKSLSSTDWVLDTTVKSIATSLGYAKVFLSAVMCRAVKMPLICLSYIQKWVLLMVVVRAVKVLRSCIQRLETMVPDPTLDLNHEPSEETESTTTDSETDQFYDTVAPTAPQEHTAELPTLGTRPVEELHSMCMRQKAPFRLKVTVSRVLSGAIQFRHQERCAFCNIQPETPQHLFFRCMIVKPIWKEFWGIETGGLVQRSWSMANWVEAVMFYAKRIVRLDGMDVDDGQLFLFLACLIESVLLERACIMVEGRRQDFEDRLKYDIGISFETFKTAFGVGSVRLV